MPILYYLSLALLVALIVNDHLLAKRIRRAIELGRLNCKELANFASGGNPIGIALNFVRLRRIPPSNASSDPDHCSIRRQYLFQQLLVASLLACLAFALIYRVAA